jgi:hypothetical protein
VIHNSERRPSVLRLSGAATLAGAAAIGMLVIIFMVVGIVGRSVEREAYVRTFVHGWVIYSFLLVPPSAVLAAVVGIPLTWIVQRGGPLRARPFLISGIALGGTLFPLSWWSLFGVFHVETLPIGSAAGLAGAAVFWAVVRDRTSRSTKTL